MEKHLMTIIDMLAWLICIGLVVGVLLWLNYDMLRTIKEALLEILTRPERKNAKRDNR